MPTATFSRADITALFARFSERGVTSPDDLDQKDPDVQAADAALEAWYASLPQETAKQRAYASFGRSTIHYDAGYRDPRYVDEVANDWLDRDEEDADNAGFNDLADLIRAKREEMNSTLRSG